MDNRNIPKSQLFHDLSLETAKFVLANQHDNGQLDPAEFVIKLHDAYMQAQRGIDEFIQKRKQMEVSVANEVIETFLDQLRHSTKMQ